MKRILLIVLLAGILVISGCASDKVCYTQAELDEMYGALESTETADTAVSYAPASGAKAAVYEQLKGIVLATAGCPVECDCGCIKQSGTTTCLPCD